MSDPKHPSMRDFDYFADKVEPASPETLADEELPSGLGEQLEASRVNRRRAGRAALTASLLLAVSTWFLWGQRDLIAYSFASPRPPQKLGDVAELTPADLPHNAYVEIEGITEHRGMTQKLMRGVVPVRDEYWYFRLLGSRGVFIEVPPDPDRYGVATRVTVRGRAVDPTREHTYGSLLQKYFDIFFGAQERPVLRIVQQGVAPGEGRLGFIVFFALIGLLLAFDGLSMWRYARARARGAIVS